ncbi:potassium transporter Kup [Entomomonas asaccharolytica]|uniref:Probable potassium transport system protein Kup n=1 Tax=Entomomonas asaccharolytica TaxID=2785331 RepID=A0A974NHA5_9GAMM|nr:potassium transporter Kup [Entomomonas asaccharolytica]
MVDTTQHSESQNLSENTNQKTKKVTSALLIGAMGVVYGDIGTSPLYTLKEVFHIGGITTNEIGVLGILSLIFWSLVWVVSFKYVIFILRADNEGEGGTMSLIALAQTATQNYPKLRKVIVLLGLFGAGLFYGDSMITPSVSVLSAVEGLMLIPSFKGLDQFIVPLAVVILIVLFLFQRFGTAHIGRLFGPIMMLWFLTLAVLGIYGIIHNPVVLKALNPMRAIEFIYYHKAVGFLILSAVVLALTGAEALYADMGHFGRAPISRAWFFFVFPALVLNYFGQGAMILLDPSVKHNPFFLLAPEWALMPLILIATLATVIASQAVISGAFSLTQQAIQLGYIPNMLIRHTSSDEKGQIYIPFINWSLMVGVVLLIFGFGSSSALASAYGIAVTGTMIITTLLVSSVVLLLWRWPLWLAIPLLLAFFIVDALYFAANLPKVMHGGEFPIIVGIVLFIIMSTWKRGRALLTKSLEENSLPLPAFISSIQINPPHRIQGTGVFLTSRLDVVPNSLLLNLIHNQILHEQIVLLTVIVDNLPRVHPDRHFKVEVFGEGFYRIVLHYGFMEEPDIPKALQQCHLPELDFNNMTTTYYLTRETIIPSKMGMARWRQALFSFMMKNASASLRYFNLPMNRVIELGTQVEI